MKRTLLLVIAGILVFLCPDARSQVSINEYGIDPDPSAMLDVSSLTRGLLVPRMNTVQMNAIYMPATGLLVYNTEEANFYYWTGSSWEVVIGSPDRDWTFSGSDLYSAVTGNVGIGTTSPQAKLHVMGDVDYPFGRVMHIENTSAAASTWMYTFYAAQNSSAPYSAGAAVMGVAQNPAGQNAGVEGQSDGDNGRGLYGLATHSSGINYGVFSHTSSPVGYSGYFEGGRNYFQGNVGIGNTDPLNTLSIYGDIYAYYPGESYGLELEGSTEEALAYIVNNSEEGKGLSAGMFSSEADPGSYGVYGFNYGTGVGVCGKTFTWTGTGVRGENTVSGNSGYIGGQVYSVYGTNSNTNFGYLGGSTYGAYGSHVQGNFGYFGGSSYGAYAYLATQSVGDYALYAYGVHGATVAGNGYGATHTIGAIKGYNYFGNAYTFATAGYTDLDNNRSGGAFGGEYAGTVWGCLAYKNSAGNEYGGYFTSSNSGSGKSSGTLTGSGLAAWGDLFGADIHGGVYGAYMTGTDYATFSDGVVFKNNLDVHLQKDASGNNIVLYTNVTAEPTVQTCGYATLSGGQCDVDFDAAFTAAVSSSSPVIVTLTPMGNTGGVYLLQVTAQGFTALENNNGKSTVQVSYIAIGKRAGYENPQLPQDVVSAGYTGKVSRGLHNDAGTGTAGEGLYYENGKLQVGVHPSTQGIPGKPAADPNVPVEK